MDTKMISIIVPIYNSGEFLEECLTSIMNQTYDNIEVILVDDGSVDNSKDICQNFIQKSNKFKYFYQDNQGVSVARNSGIVRAKGDYITCVDSDDFIDNDYCEKLMKYMKLDIDMVVLGIDYFSNGKYSGIRNRFTPGFYNIDDIKKMAIDDGSMSGFTFHSSCAILYKKEIIDKNNILFNINVKYNEDGLFNVEYVFNCKKGLYFNYDNVVYHYRVNANSASRTMDYLGEKYNNSMSIIFDVLSKYEVENLEHQMESRNFLLGLKKLQYIAKNKIGLKKFKEVLKSHQMRKRLKKIRFSIITFPKKITYILIKINFIRILYLLLKIK